MNNGWNFKGWIALPLEMYGRKYIGGTFFSADEIETGSFIDAMLQIMLVTYGNLDNVRVFADQCNRFEAEHGPRCKNEDAMALFREFERLIKLYEGGNAMRGEDDE